MRTRLFFVVLLLLAAPAVAQQKFALAVYHFNIQYVQGGLIGFPDGMTMNAAFDLNDAQVQDLIITQSFQPLLEMYLRHPTWGADIEMQGYMLDIIVARHPDALQEMKQLAAQGNVSFDSLHWADQFWIAFPAADEEESFALTQASFQAAGIPYGTSIFSQEGQFALGLGPFLKARGVPTVMLATGALSWSAGVNNPDALYTFDGTNDVIAVPTGGVSDSFVNTIWEYCDDGELAMTNGLDPYVGTGFKYNASAAEMYEQQLEADETAGYEHVSVGTYVKKALALGEQPRPIPPVLDGTWHPADTFGVYTWMGKPSLEDSLAPGTSADNAVNTQAMQAHRALMTAINVTTQLKLHKYDATIAQAWQDLLLSEGSDATGINPWMGEREYSETHSQAVLDAVNTILSDPAIKPRLEAAVKAPELVDDPGPFQLTWDTTGERMPQIAWKRRKGTDIWEVAVTWSAVANNPADSLRQYLTIEFPRTGDNVIFVPALNEQTLRTVPLANIPGGAEGIIPVTAADGLVGLGNDQYVIKQTTSVHVAAQFPKTKEVVLFQDNTASTDKVEWDFVVMQNATSDQAIAEATTDNLDAPQTLGPAVGCGGCQNAPLSGAPLLLVLILCLRQKRKTPEIV